MNLSENLKFDSMILAGGFGTRLAPLTDSIPKPMLPVASESAFMHNIKHLRKNGFDHTAVTTMYLPEQIESVRFEQGTIEYFREEIPLGSAGAVAQLKNRTEDCLLVISGDAICDFDLGEARRQFLESGCDAAILLSRTSDVGEYGSVRVHNGLVIEFCEKPSVRDTLSDLINTGIYFINGRILKLIPNNKKYDFARDLFPAMLRANMRISGIEPKGRWFDIGSFGEYHRCNMWLSGGENCIGKKASIHPNARIDKSIIFDNCTIGNSVIHGSIVAEGVVIGNGCIVPRGCVIGPGSELRDGTSLSPGTVVQTGDTISGAALYDAFPKPKNRLEFDDDCVITDEGDDGYFVRFGGLLGGDRSVIAFAEGGAMTLAQACEIACGASEAGSACTVISGGSASLASFAAMEYRSKTAYIYRRDGRTEIKLFSSNGMPFSREELRKLSAKKPEKSSNTGSVFLLPHGALMKRYLFHLKARAFLPKSINVADDRKNDGLRECVEEFGITLDKSKAEFSVSDDGEQATAKLPDGRKISYWQLLAICCIEGKRELVVLPRDTPEAVEQILKRHSMVVKFYGDSESESRKLAEHDRLHRDGILLAITSAGLAERKGCTLAELADALPPFTVMTRTVFADRDKMASVISRLREECGKSRCAGFEFGDGRVSVFPCAAGRFRLIAEAVDSETAEEISLRAIDMLEGNKFKP